MSDDHVDEDVFELTEDMTSEEEPDSGSDSASLDEPRESVDDVPRPSSPFTLLAEPKRTAPTVVAQAPAEEKSRGGEKVVKKRKALEPGAEKAVVAMPIMRMDASGGAKSKTKADKEPAKKPEKVAAPEAPSEETAIKETLSPANIAPDAPPVVEPAAEETAAEETAAEETAAEETPAEENPAEVALFEATPGDDDDGDEVLQLGQEFVVESQDEPRADASEPILLLTKSIPPPSPPDEDGDTEATAPKKPSSPPPPPAKADGASRDMKTPPPPPPPPTGEISTTESPEDREVLVELDDADMVRQPPPPPSPPAKSTPTTDEAPEGDAVDTGSDLGVYDFGTPEMVFDAPVDEEEDHEEHDVLVEEEIDLEEAEDVTPAQESDSASFLRKAAATSKGKRPPRMRRKRKKSEWWSRIFDDDYLMLLPSFSKRETRKQIEFIQQALGVKPGSLVLDMACGNGRLAVAMAQRNYRVVGVDLSLSMLARAGEAAQDAGQKINFIHGDMRDLGFERTFDAVYCMDTSFGFFDEQTNKKVLEGVHRALKPGAVLLLEVANRDFAIKQQPNLTWFQLENMVCMEETDFNYINSRLYITRQLIIGDGERQTKHEFSLRLYSLHELGQMLHNAGFAVTKVSGNRATSGAFFGPESPKLIIAAQRR